MLLRIICLLLPLMLPLVSTKSHGEDNVVSMFYGIGRAPDRSEAIRVARKLAVGEDAPSLYVFGALVFAYEEADAQLLQEAVVALKKSSLAGDVRAQLLLGEILSESARVERDLPSAAEHYKSAALLGSDEGCIRYARLVRREGFDVDLRKSHACLNRLADGGSAPANELLSVLYQVGTNGYEKDIENSIKFLKVAAMHGSIYANTAIGIRYANGVGMKKDIFAAFEHLEYSSIRGDVNATNAISKLILGEPTLNKDICQKAMKLKGLPDTAKDALNGLCVP